MPDDFVGNFINCTTWSRDCRIIQEINDDNRCRTKTGWEHGLSDLSMRSALLLVDDIVVQIFMFFDRMKKSRFVRSLHICRNCRDSKLFSLIPHLLLFHLNCLVNHFNLLFASSFRCSHERLLNCLFRRNCDFFYFCFNSWHPWRVCNWHSILSDFRRR